MKTWSHDLDQKFAQLTSGPNDITGASQLQEVYDMSISDQEKVIMIGTASAYET